VLDDPLAATRDRPLLLIMHDPNRLERMDEVVELAGRPRGAPRQP
jgi:hypothetical protein